MTVSISIDDNKMTQNKHLFSLLMVFVLAITGCGGAEVEPPVERVRPAKLFEVQLASKQRTLSFPAVVEAVQTAELTFPQGGEVIELSLLQGTTVTAGQLIAKLDQSDAENNLVQARAEFQNAQSEYNRALRLSEQNAISRSVLESRETQVQVTRASVENAEKALEDTVLRAPFSGTISEVFVEQFQNVAAKEAIVTLQSSETEAVINVPSAIIARLPQLEPQGTRVALDAAPDTEVFAEFREAAGVADAASQTFAVSFLFEPPEGLLILPGMTATVSTNFLFGEDDDVVSSGFTVPLSAVLAEGEQRFVWIVQPDMSVHRQEVALSPVATDKVTVLSGLVGGETVVAGGVTFLHEGMKVRGWEINSL